MRNIYALFVGLLLLLLVSGCDIPWGTIADNVYYDGSTLYVFVPEHGENDGDDSWWEENDEHLDWMLWPANQLF